MSAEAHAAFCKKRAESDAAKAERERDPERRAYFEREALSWRQEQMFYEAMARA